MHAHEYFLEDILFECTLVYMLVIVNMCAHVFMYSCVQSCVSCRCVRELRATFQELSPLSPLLPPIPESRDSTDICPSGVEGREGIG